MIDAEVTAQLQTDNMENLPSFAGLVKSLFFTHNTLITILYTIITSADTRYIRCCDHDGTAINKGAQFRHGLDSQYGDIVFVMHKEFWRDKKGMDYHNRSSVAHAIVGHVHKHDFVEYDGPGNTNIVDRWLEIDAKMYDMRKPIPPGVRLGNGKECRGVEWQFSWCNLQIHMGENIELTNVRRVYAPAWLLHDTMMMSKIEANGVNATLLRLLVSNQLPNYPNGDQAPNPLNGLFHLYGPPLANDHYHMIFKARRKIGQDDLANSTYDAILPTSFGQLQHIPTHRSASHSSSTVFLDEKAFIDLEIRYMADLVYHNMTDLPHSAAWNISKSVLYHPHSLLEHNMSHKEGNV